MKCADCGTETYVTHTSYGSIPLCNRCLDEREHARLEEKSLNEYAAYGHLLTIVRN